MAERLITISATTDNPTPLQISDWQGHEGTDDATDAALTTEVQPGDIVRWQIAGNITAITNITVKSGSSNVFASGPAKDESDDSWAGVIGATESGSTESYSISYTVEGHPTEPPFIEDPKIEVKPTV